MRDQDTAHKGGTLASSIDRTEFNGHANGADPMPQVDKNYLYASVEAQRPGLFTRLVRRALYRVTSSRPLRVIDEDGRPYLERSFLWTGWGVTIYLHRFVGSDPDRGLHDHPWDWAASFVLSGWYQELLEGRTRRVRFFNWLRGTTYHRVLLPHEGSEAWTLFVHHAKNSKSWGFRDVPTDPTKTASGENRRDWWVDAPLGRSHPKRVAPRA
jgi:hypothetical protein